MKESPDKENVELFLKFAIYRYNLIEMLDLKLSKTHLRYFSRGICWIVKGESFSDFVL